MDENDSTGVNRQSYGSDGALDRGDYSAANSNADSSDNPDAIRADIRETRDRVGDTLEQIGDRLNPHHITEQVRDNLREATIGRVEHMAENAADRVTETRDSIMETIRDNPIPAAMIGIGIGWLFMNGRNSDSSSTTTASGSRPGYRKSRYAEWQSRNPGYASGLYQGAGTGYGRTSYADAYASEGMADGDQGTVDHLRDRAGELGHNVKDRAGDLADRAQNVAGNIADRTQSAASSLADHTQNLASSIADGSRAQTRRVEDLFYESPLVAGVASVAIGLAAGLALPSTQKESELMGDARDHFVDRARQVAGDTKTKVGHVAERVVDQAQTTATEAARSEGLTA